MPPLRIREIWGHFFNMLERSKIGDQSTRNNQQTSYPTKERKNNQKTMGMHENQGIINQCYALIKGKNEVYHNLNSGFILFLKGFVS